MTAEPREELISAYLDGELSESQRAEVEKGLAESSQLRQLHAELLAVRAGMQSLERHQLDRDMSDAVLRRAEQSVLRGAEAKPLAATIRPAPAPTSWWNRGAGWRRVAWPALAVAAALVILVYDANQRPAEREVARAPEQDELALAPEGRPELRASEREGSALSRELERDDRGRAVELRAAPDRDGDDYRPREPSLEYRRSESLPRQRMLKDLVKPGAAQPASESAPGSAALKESLDAPFGKLKAGGDLVLECTPQFLRDRKFEKLLDEKEIKWRRVGENKTREKKAESGKGVEKLESLASRAAVDQPLRVTYFVSGTLEQVNGILAELERSVRRRAGVPYENLAKFGEASSLPPQSQAGAAGGKASGFTITLVAPAAASPPAAVPADESP